MPIISVIVPVFKVEPYLCRCVDSILAQTFTDFELILVDDGSPDHCGAICDEYAQKDKRIHVIHQENGGLSAARNAGLDTAKGEFVFFVDADDRIHRETLEREYDALIKHNADIAICGIKRFHDLDNPFIDNASVDAETTVFCGKQMEAQLFQEGVDLARVVSSCGKLYKKQLFSFLRFPLGRLFEDEFVIYKLYHLAERVVDLHADLYDYYVNADGITQNLTLEKRLDEYDAQIERIVFYQTENDKALYAKALLRFLKTAQWDLIAYQKNPNSVDPNRGAEFVKNYRAVLQQAEMEGVVSFSKNYDYYAIAYPEKRLLLRIKKKLSIFLGLLK